MTTALYTAYHKVAPPLVGPSIVPIQVGRALAAGPLHGMIGDDTGDNISDQNRSYCELTALYWAWKNAPAEHSHIGLMHYRRLLDLSGDHPSTLAEVTPKALHTPDWIARTEGWLSENIGTVDLVLPRLHEMGRSVEANYCATNSKADLDTARGIIARDHPDMLRCFDRVLAGRSLRLGNMMLMRRDLFDGYCAWLFPVLAEVAEGVDFGTLTATQHRVIGFLAERLLTVYAAHLIETQPDLRLREVSILNLARTLVTPFTDDPGLNAPDQINVAFAADRAYLPHGAAMVRSLLDHANRDRQINLFFLQSGLGERGQAMLRNVVAEAHPNATLNIIDVGGMFDEAYRSESRSPSNATYARFLLFRLLPGLKRLLYLDCDTIVRQDISALFDADLGGAPIAGVTDWIMTRTLTGPTPTIDPDVPDLAAYHREKLGLSDDQIAGYINAGVVLFNFAAMDDVEATGRDLIEQAETGRFLFRDQDILNAHFKGRIAQLDPRWNVFNSTEAAYRRVPSSLLGKALGAKADPWLIHYADAAWKPWTPSAVPLAQHYWQALIKTPFYGEVLGQDGGPMEERPTAWQHIAGLGLKVAEAVPFLKRPLLRFHALLGRPGRR